MTPPRLTEGHKRFHKLAKQNTPKFFRTFREEHFSNLEVLKILYQNDGIFKIDCRFIDIPVDEFRQYMLLTPLKREFKHVDSDLTILQAIPILRTGFKDIHRLRDSECILMFQYITRALVSPAYGFSLFYAKPNQLEGEGVHSVLFKTEKKILKYIALIHLTSTNLSNKNIATIVEIIRKLLAIDFFQLYSLYCKMGAREHISTVFNPTDSYPLLTGIFDIVRLCISGEEHMWFHPSFKTDYPRILLNYVFVLNNGPIVFNKGEVKVHDLDMFSSQLALDIGSNVLIPNSPFISFSSYKRLRTAYHNYKYTNKMIEQVQGSETILKNRYASKSYTDSVLKRKLQNYFRLLFIILNTSGLMYDFDVNEAFSHVTNLNESCRDTLCIIHSVLPSIRAFVEKSTQAKEGGLSHPFFLDKSSGHSIFPHIIQNDKKTTRFTTSIFQGPHS